MGGWHRDRSRKGALNHKTESADPLALSSPYGHALLVTQLCPADMTRNKTACEFMRPRSDRPMEREDWYIPTPQQVHIGRFDHNCLTKMYTNRNCKKRLTTLCTILATYILYRLREWHYRNPHLNSDSIQGHTGPARSPKRPVHAPYSCQPTQPKTLCLLLTNDLVSYPS